MGIIHIWVSRVSPPKGKSPRSNMLIDKINLDLPVEAYDKDGNLKEKAEPVLEEDSTKVPQTEEKTVVDKKDEEDEQRVPYSRFSKVRERAEASEQDAEEARQLLRDMQARSEVSRVTPSSSYEEDYAREVKKLYGDTPVAEEIIKINLRREQEVYERAEQRALEAIDRRQRGEVQAIAQNENILDSRLESLSDQLGRQLTNKEEAALLEIVDEFTPVGQDGKYAGEIMPFEKAWEVLELRQTQASRTRPRNPAIIASGSKSQGEPNGDVQEKNNNFNPLNWKSLYDRIK